MPPSPYVTSRGEESKSYFRLKEKRKSLTLVIIVLSPWSQILFAECLTDPTGKSFTLHLLRQPSHERSFYLTRRPTFQTAHSAVVRLSSPKEENHSLCLTICPWRRVISTHLRMISWDPAQSNVLCLFDCPKSQALLDSCDCPTPGRRCLFHFLLMWSSHSRDWPTLLLSVSLTVLPKRIPPCRLFDLITMPALQRERGWVTLHLTTSLPSFCVVYCMSASFSFINANLLPSTTAPTVPLSLPSSPQCGR